MGSGKGHRYCFGSWRYRAEGGLELRLEGDIKVKRLQVCY